MVFPAVQCPCHILYLCHYCSCFNAPPTAGSIVIHHSLSLSSLWMGKWIIVCHCLEMSVRGHAPGHRKQTCEHNLESVVTLLRFFYTAKWHESQMTWRKNQRCPLSWVLFLSLQNHGCFSLYRYSSYPSKSFNFTGWKLEEILCASSTRYLVVNS